MSITLEKLTEDELNTRILKERAKILARPIADEAPEECITVLHFQLAYEQYAIETKYIREALFIKEITPLPLSPKFVVGVVNVRGDIMSALDIRKFFNLAGEPINDLNRLLVISDNTTAFGILVDRIRDIKEIPLVSLRMSDNLNTGIKEEFIKGIIEDNIIVLDGEKLIASPSIIVNQF